MIIQKDQSYDYVFLGNSHARNFSRHGNHGRVEKKLARSILNLGQGGGICGPNDQNIYLSYALSKNVKFKHLILTVSPPYLYGDAFNETTLTLFAEPFQFDFFFHYLSQNAINKNARLAHYLRSKWRPLWWASEPTDGQAMLDYIDKTDSTAIQHGFELAYPKGRKEASFLGNAAHIEAAIEMANQQRAQVTLLSTPTVFGHWPGQERVARYADSLVLVNENVRYLDLSNLIQDPGLFYDHHHLNSAGIDRLAQELKNLGY